MPWQSPSCCGMRGGEASPGRQIIDFARGLHHATSRAAALQSEGGPRRLMVGLTGYPNVGKSSTINALFGSKKTAVAPTPGKTKHFQTLNVTERLTLCDCPGLVLPRYAASKAEMVAAGGPCSARLRRRWRASVCRKAATWEVYVSSIYVTEGVQQSRLHWRQQVSAKRQSKTRCIIVKGEGRANVSFLQRWSLLTAKSAPPSLRRWQHVQLDEAAMLSKGVGPPPGLQTAHISPAGCAILQMSPPIASRCARPCSCHNSGSACLEGPADPLQASSTSSGSGSCVAVVDAASACLKECLVPLQASSPSTG